MKSQNSTNGLSLPRAVSGALVGASLAFGLVTGVSPVASAQPTTQKEQPPAPRISPDQILAMISNEYQTGSGGGQVSKLIEQVMTLRARGIRPSFGNTQALAAALDERPNQKPLIDALNATLVYQRKVMAQGASQMPAQSGGAPPVATPGSPGGGMGPNWGPGNPMQQDGDTIFPMPGR
ncbi:hypothetical protein [Mycolicibacterium iranicum]|uniref:Uncharacterized protein n=1 Tax=Mycolicibacterium iranicum TaxID=912594 RepID=A0A178LPX4_MYCIR|nr:hypothetical protein [Mycolicibacterium iranicum]OAN33376.1 hypothetical protein A4X20_28005 [Mycolicibacterium iranicum]